MSRAQPLDEVTDDDRDPGAFVREEIRLLLHSTGLRIEQQRIHIKELSGQIGESVRAKRDLKELQATYSKLQAYLKQFTQKTDKQHNRPSRSSAAAKT